MGAQRPPAILVHSVCAAQLGCTQLQYKDSEQQSTMQSRTGENVCTFTNVFFIKGACKRRCLRVDDFGSDMIHK